MTSKPSKPLSATLDPTWHPRIKAFAAALREIEHPSQDELAMLREIAKRLDLVAEEMDAAARIAILASKPGPKKSKGSTLRELAGIRRKQGRKPANSPAQERAWVQRIEEVKGVLRGAGMKRPGDIDALRYLAWQDILQRGGTPTRQLVSARARQQASALDRARRRTGTQKKSCKSASSSFDLAAFQDTWLGH